MTLFNRKLRTEALEQRLLLSADTGLAAVERFDLRDLAVMYAPNAVATPLVESFSSDRTATLRQVDISSLDLSASGYEIIDGSITVSVMGYSSSQDLLPALVTAGLTPTFVSPHYSTVDGTIPLSRLHELMEADGVATVLPFMPESLTNSVGSVVNDAEIALRAETIRDFLGLTGAGVTIGVISNGVGGVGDSQATNDLPPNAGTPGAAVTLNVLAAGTGNEGTAMLELVHDIAPGSNLLFNAAGASEAAFANAVNALVAAGADVIVDDVNGLVTESWFADGAAATAITAALDAGVFYASSAGNRGDNAFEAAANFVANQNVLGNMGTFHDFDGNGNFLQQVTITGDSGVQDFQLQFDQLFTAVTSDVRLWLFDAFGNFIASSTQNNNVTGDPNDFLFINGTGVGQLAIELVAGPAPQRLRWIHWGDVGAIQFDAIGGNLRTGRDPGHAATVGNVAVGAMGNSFPNATNVTQPLVRQAYSGIGEVTRTIDATGAALPATLFRGGPTLMGIDGTNTSVDDLDGLGNPVAGWNDFTVFHGTSAAAPNVAAIAALLLEANPSLDPEGVRAALTQSALDIEAPGIDLTTGAGFVDGLGALGLAGDITNLVGLADDEYVLVNDASDAIDLTPGDGVVDSNIATGEQRTLRAAVMEANVNNNLRVVLLPDGVYGLTLTGSENGAANNDLDITGDVTIVGAGAGLSVIDANFAVTPNSNTRVFEVSGANRFLALSRLTVAGGDTTSVGGAAYVASGGALTARQTVFVGNHASQRGGAIRNLNGTLDITDSVFTGNASDYLGGAISSVESSGVVNLGRTIFAENTASSGFANTELSNGTLTSEGLNLLDDASGAGGFFAAERGDRIENPLGDLDIVTSVADRLDHADDATALTLREAVDNANGDDGTVWLPAWRFELDRNGTESNTAAFNDLDILGDVTITGIGAGLTSINLSQLDDASTMQENRAFQVSGAGRSLDLSHITVFGGTTTMSIAGSLAFVTGGAVLHVSDSAIVNHLATMGNGVVIRAAGGEVTIRRSVFTNNVSTQSAVAAVYSNGGGSLRVGESIFALNANASSMPLANIVFQGVDASSLGNNLYDTDGTAGSQFFKDASDRTGTPDLVVTSAADQLLSSDDSYARTLREAVNEANATAGLTEVWAPAWHYRLALSGAESADTNDFDISGDVRLVGVGPGLTVIDAGGLDDPTYDTNSRAFQIASNVGAELELSRLSLVGGLTTEDMAGNGVLVGTGARLDVSETAIVNQMGMANGVAIRSVGGNVTVERSVLTNNTSTALSSGVYSTSGGSLTIGESVFARNAGVTHDNVFADSSVSATSLGNNLYDNHNASGNSFAFNGTGDMLGSTDRVVTTVADTFDHEDDQFSLSVREAVDLSNQSGGEEIWLPAWDFVLTRERDYATQLDDTDVSYGDIDISESIVIRGISGATTIDWHEGTVIPDNNRDKVFDLLGSTADGTADATATGADFLIWQQEYGGGVGNPEFEEFLADFNDDGMVDGDDQSSVWQQYFGNSLDLEDITVLS